MAVWMDHAAVLAMALTMAWPLALTLAALPLLLAIVQLKRGDWDSARRRRATVWTFVLAALAGAPLIFALFGGGWGDLRYWLDVVALVGMSLAIAAYVALLAYLVAGLISSRSS